MPRSTQSERRAVDDLTRRIVDQRRQDGAPAPSAEQARRKAVEIAERSNAERRDRGR